MRPVARKLAVLGVLGALAACEDGRREEPTPPSSSAAGLRSGSDTEPENTADPRAEERRRMVQEQLRERDITDEAVLRAMGEIPRHRFMPEDQRDEAYDDHPLPIGHGQTISQPYIVALMSQLAEVSEGDEVLEIGTGSGYQAAVLAELGAEVYTIEIVEPLGKEARERLKQLGYDNVHVRLGDGYAGWPEHAPFDAVLVTAAPPRIPDPLKEQLAVGGRMVIPVGEVMQELRILERTESGIVERKSIPVRFVPMTGKAQED